MSGIIEHPASGVMEGGFAGRPTGPAYGNIETPALFGLIHSDAIRMSGPCPDVIAHLPMGGCPA